MRSVGYFSFIFSKALERSTTLRHTTLLHTFKASVKSHNVWACEHLWVAWARIQFFRLLVIFRRLPLLFLKKSLLSPLKCLFSHPFVKPQCFPWWVLSFFVINEKVNVNQIFSLVAERKFNLSFNFLDDDGSFIKTRKYFLKTSFDSAWFVLKNAAIDSET